MTQSQSSVDTLMIEGAIEALTKTPMRAPLNPDVIWFQAEFRRRIDAQTRVHTPLNLGISIGIVGACFVSILLIALLMPTGSTPTLFTNSTLVMGALGCAGLIGGFVLLGLQLVSLKSHTNFQH